jgi:hypothetical protein
MIDPQTRAALYVALWNETDPAARRRAIEAFFAPDAEHFVGGREAIGYAALEARITGSHEKNIRDNGNAFRAAPGAQQLRDVLLFDWHMTPANDPRRVLAVGREVIRLDERGRALSDHMFIIG